MNNKYLSLIQNLVSNTKENKAMSGDELRARINNAFINYQREILNRKAMKNGEKLLPLETFKEGKRNARS